MSNYTSYIVNILDNIHDLTRQEFKTNNFDFVVKKPTIKDVFNQRDTQDINRIKYNIYRSKKSKQNRAILLKNNKEKEINIDEIDNMTFNSKNKTLENEIELHDNIDIITDVNLFNIVDDKTKLIKWKDISNENKKIKILNYIQKTYIDFPSELINKINELIDKNKINFKKYIIYNEYTQEIDKTPIVNYKKNKYSLNYSSVKVKKKKKITF